MKHGNRKPVKTGNPKIRKAYRSGVELELQ
jgi:hypothetical protein